MKQETRKSKIASFIRASLISLLVTSLFVQTLGRGVLAYPITPPITPPVTTTPTPIPQPDLGLIINPKQVQVTVTPYVFKKIFDLTAVKDTNYYIVGYTLDNSLTSIQISPYNGFLGKGYTIPVSLRVGADTKPGIYKAIVAIRNKENGIEEKIPTQITVTSATPTPTIVPTATPTPTYMPIPTATPTPAPVNHNPVIYPKQNMLPIASTKRNYLAYIWVYDVDRDKVNVSISNLPAGLNYNCADGFSTQVKTCTLSGRPVQTGLFTVSVQAKDARGGETIKKYYLLVSPKLFWWL